MEMPFRPLRLWLGLALVLAAAVAPRAVVARSAAPGRAPAAAKQQTTSADAPKASPASATAPGGSSTASVAPVPHPLVLSVQPVQVASGVSFPYDIAALQSGVVKYLNEVFRQYHWIARYDVRSAPGASSAGQAPDPTSAPAYILDLEVTQWNATKFPPEVTVSDYVASATAEEKIFSQTDAILDDGSGDFPDLIARVLASRIYPRFAEHAEDPRTAPKTCLVRGCELEPHVSKKSSIITWGLMASNPVSLPGIPILLARQKKERKQDSQRNPPEGVVIAHGADLDRDADETGYVTTRSQRRFIEHTMGYAGCYDAKERPTNAHMKLLRNVVSLLKGQNYYRVPSFYWTVLYMTPRPACMNSESLTDLKMVFVFTSLMDALHWNRDEIAGVIAHEAGHLQDRSCERTIDEAISLSKPASMRQVCEDHADNIGLQYMLAAGFDPTRFAYSFAAFENIDPEGESRRLRRSSDHPTNRNRITNVVQDLDALCNQGMERACHFRSLVNETPAEKNGAP